MSALPESIPFSRAWRSEHAKQGDQALRYARQELTSGRSEVALAWTRVADQHYRAAALDKQS